MKNTTNRGLWTYFLLGIALLNGCATLRKEKMSATDAIARAEASLKSSEEIFSPVYAPQEHNQAQTWLMEARSRFAGGKYKEAAVLANDADAAAQMAAAKARVEKERQEAFERQQREALEKRKKRRGAVPKNK